jgi:arsenate reductase
MAETIFNTIAKKWIAESAGVERAEKIDETAKRLLEEEGFAVKKKKPRTIDKIDLEDYDLIIAVCEESCVSIPSKPVERWYIKNPAGKSEEDYKKVLDDIKCRVKKLLEEIE